MLRTAQTCLKVIRNEDHVGSQTTDAARVTSGAPVCRTGRRFVWYSASMVLTFRTVMLSEGEEVVRVIRAAFTPYVRALGREFPADGSVQFAEERERFAA